MTSQRQALLGLFFVLVFGILGWFTLFESDLSLFREKVTVRVHFEQAGGLRAGDPVLVAGLRWGEVEGLEYDPEERPEQRVAVDLLLDQQVRLFGDHQILIEDATVLGGKQLVIDPGEPATGEVPLTDLYGEVSPGVMKALGDIVADNRESLTNILAGLEVVVGDLQTGEGTLARLLHDEQLATNLSNAVASVAVTFENAEALTENLREGRGTLGRLMNDPELYEQIQDLATGIDGFVATATGLVDDARAGKGTLGMLLTDEEASADLKAAIDRIAAITGDLEQGRGTLGKLLNDPAIANNVEKITADLAEGRGTLGLLLTEDGLYQDLRQIAEDLADASAALRGGHGTLAKLLYEDEIYTEIERALGVLTGTLEEAREAAPISTFLNTVFLGF